MKKYAKWIIVTVIFILTGTSVYPTKLVTNPASSQKTLINYTWYKDEELTDLTGTVSEINVECNRLSLLFPTYTFSSSLAMGLYEYEYGYYPGLPVVIIYSNL